MGRIIPDAFDDLEIGITLHDPETGEVCGVNQRLEELYGYTAAELREMSVSEYTADDSGFTQVDAERRIRAAAEGEPQTFKWQIQRSTDECVWVRVRLAETTLDGDRYVIAEIRDITERTEREAELSVKNQAIEQAPVGITLTDPTREGNPLVYANRAFLDLTGYSQSEVMGWFHDELQGPETSEAAIEEFQTALDNRESTTVELRNYTKDGTMFWNSVSIAPIHDDSGELTNWVGFQEDITDRKEYETQLERSNERLQQFAYILSHDLQEPLRMVSSYVDLLEMELDNLDDETQQYMQFAVDGANRMRSMIDGLLQYSRVETDGADFDETDVEAVFDGVSQDLQLMLDEADATLSAGDLPTLRADTDQVGQLFQNLITNAVDHGGEETTIEISAEQIPDGYRFAVSDDGPGIPADQQDDIFGLFDKGTDSDGTGIGLAVCERIANRHNGEIWVESAADEGSTFYFTIETE